MRALLCLVPLLATPLAAGAEDFEARIQRVEQRLAALRDTARAAKAPVLAIDRRIAALGVALEAARAPDGNAIDAARIRNLVDRRARLEARRVELTRAAVERRALAVRAANKQHLEALLSGARRGDAKPRQELTQLVVRIDQMMRTPVPVTPRPTTPGRAPKRESSSVESLELERQLVQLTRQVFTLEDRLRKLRRMIAKAEGE